MSNDPNDSNPDSNSEPYQAEAVEQTDSAEGTAIAKPTDATGQTEAIWAEPIDTSAKTFRPAKSRVRLRADVAVGLISLLILGMIGLLTLHYIKNNARETDCQNQMREIGMGTLAFEAAFSQLPNSTLGATRPASADLWGDPESEFYWRNQQNTSALAQIAPYLELANKVKHDPRVVDFEKAIPDFEDENLTWQGDFLVALKLAQKSQPTLLCPEDSHAPELATAIATQPISIPFSVNGTPPKNLHDDMERQLWTEEGSLAKTNYLANGGVCGGAGFSDSELTPFVGPLRCREKTTIASISDGTTSTIIFGETIGEIKNYKRTEAMSWFWGGHGRGRGDVPYHSDYDLPEPPGYDFKLILGDEEQASIFGFGSKHKSIVVFGFADGSVNNIERGVDQDVFFGLLGSSDGEQPFRLQEGIQ